MGYIPPDEISEMMDDWKPSAELVQEEVTAYRSGWLGQMEKRVGAAFFLQTGLFLLWGLWRAGGLMLVGSSNPSDRSGFPDRRDSVHRCSSSSSDSLSKTRSDRLPS